MLIASRQAWAQSPTIQHAAPCTWASAVGPIWGNSHFPVQPRPFTPHASTTEGGGKVSLYWGAESKGTATQTGKDLELYSSYICSHGPGEKHPQKVNSSQSSHFGYSQIRAFLLNSKSPSSWTLSTAVWVAFCPLNRVPPPRSSCQRKEQNEGSFCPPRVQSNTKYTPLSSLLKNSPTYCNQVTVNSFKLLYMCMYTYICICVCMYTPTQIHTHTSPD